MEQLLRVISELRRNEYEIIKIETQGLATPLAKVGIERASMKTDLIPTERMRHILIESAKVRLLNEVRSFLCTNCWDYLEMICIKDLPNKPICPHCGSSAIGMLKREENYVRSLVEKKGEKLTTGEQKMYKSAVKTAQLISQYGKAAAIALSARRVKSEDVRGALQKEKQLNDEFFESVIEAERKALKRSFWAD